MAFKFDPLQVDPKFIYFDLDDTLLNHKKAERAALLDLHDYFSLFDSVDADRLVETYHKINGEQWVLYSEGEINSDQLQQNRFELTLRALGLNDEHFDKIGSKYLQFYQNHWQWIDGAREAFQRVRTRYNVGILTNGFTEVQKKKFKRFNLYDQAKYLVISEEVGVLKPNPAIFEHATRLAGYKAGEILYVGDSYRSDVTGGHSYGWNVAWYTNGSDPNQTDGADFIFKSYNKLCDWLNV